MADLKDIRGIRAQALASDPYQPGSSCQICYNDTVIFIPHLHTIHLGVFYEKKII